MANKKQLSILRQGPEAWNAWRQKRPNITLNLSGVDLRRANLRRADLREDDLRRANLSAAYLSEAYLRRANLSEADLREADLRRANLSAADLRTANLSGAYLSEADLREADFRGTNLHGANLREADFRTANLSKANLSAADLREADFRAADLSAAYLRGTNLSGVNLRAADLRAADLRAADLREANLSGADLGGANLVGANLQGALLVDTRLENANLRGCRVYGISAWNLYLKGARQADLIITKDDQPEITVDNLEVAQFIYLLLNNERIRHVINTITSKVVLILGRFTLERKAVLDSFREELRKRDYLPVLFDFERPSGQTITETISLLARMARFVIADITDAKSIPQELGAIVPDLPSVPVQPLLLEGSGEYSMFEHFRRYPWVLPLYVYGSSEQLIADVSERVIGPAEAKAKELRVPIASTTA